MKKIIFTIVLSVTVSTISFAQNVGIGTTAPDASALLELSSTSKGLLPPRMTAAQKTAIVSPKTGLIIYQTDLARGLYIYDGTAWTAANASGNFVDLTTAQNINGNKTFTADIVVNGVRIGKGGNAGSLNTAVGFNVLNANTTGFSNAAFGY